MVQKSFKEAEADLTRVIDAVGMRGDIYLLRARARRELGDSVQQLSDLDQALKFEPTLAEAYLMRAQLKAAGQADEAMEDLRWAAKYGSKDPELPLLQARLLMHKGEAAAANEAWTRVLNQTPGLMEALIGRARMREKLDDRYGAIDDWSTVLNADPDNVDAWVSRGVLRHRAGNPRSALEDMEKALSLKPDHPRALLERGRLYFYAQDLEKAVADLTQVLQVDEKNAQALLLRGQAFAKLERVTEALKDLKRAIQLDPSMAPGIKPIIESLKPKSDF
jgi:tetratricopeptide (TPR) repeat protein